MSELLPCPFCGGEAVAFGGSMEAIHCSNRDCALEHYSMPANKWNRRPQPVSGVPSVEELESKLMRSLRLDVTVNGIVPKGLEIRINSEEVARAIHAILQQSAVQPVSREASRTFVRDTLAKVYRDGWYSCDPIMPCDSDQDYADDMPDTINALLSLTTADGGWVAVERRIRAARFGVEAIKGRVLASGESSEYAKANLEQLILTMGQLDDAINALPPPPAKGKGK